MDDKHLHIKSSEDESLSFFSKGKVIWKKSEADVWAELERKMQTTTVPKTIVLKSIIVRWSVAAVFAILLGLSGITFFYSKTVVSLPGEKNMAELPDGSLIELNSGSSLKYYPVKWNFQRKVFFEGEGFFDVQKGNSFEVVSVNGTTRVLGTKFNIYAREDNYRVTCFSGLVEVVSSSNESVLLKPENHVEIKNGKLIMSANYKTEKAIDWKLNQFDFTSRPLLEVFREIELRYNVRIQFGSELGNRNFSSNFTKPVHVEEVLDYVCKSMQLKFVKQSENVFLIVKENE